MSGCDKSISTFLKLGPVEKFLCTKVYKLFFDFDKNSHSSVTTKKWEGAESTFETDFQKKGNGKYKFKWSYDVTNQIEGCTINNKYESDEGKLTGWIDFGSNLFKVKNLTT